MELIHVAFIQVQAKRYFTVYKFETTNRKEENTEQEKQKQVTYIEK
jgi:hypothetical protein